MTILRRIGLAAAVALVVMALGGPVSAFASETTICKSAEDTPYCKSEDSYPSGTTFKATSSKVTIAGDGGVIIECSESALEGQTTAASGDAVPLTLDWTLDSCTNNYKQKCTTEVVEGGYDGSLKRTSEQGGTLTVALTGFPEGPGWHLNCEGSWCSLEFNPTNPALSFDGGASAEVTATTVPMKSFGPWWWCPSYNPTFTATYTVDSPEPAYLAAPATVESHTRLCKVDESPCQIGNTYPLGTMIEAEAPTLKVQSKNFTIDCGKSTLSAKTQAVGAEPLPLGNVTFSLSGCKSTQIGNCSVQTSAMPIQSWITAGEGHPYHNPYLALYSSWSFDCTALDCEVSTEGALASLSHSEEKAVLVYEGAALNQEGGLCGSMVSLTATFTVTAPEPLFAT